MIHGTGSSRKAWEPVVPLLRDRLEVLLVDLPGHGESELAPPGVTPTPIGFAPLVADVLDDLGFDRAHAAGFSVGGWTSLELAKLGRTRSVTAFGPAGLWKPRSPRAAQASLWLAHHSARVFDRLLPITLGSAVGRTLFLSQMYGRPRQLSREEAVDAARTMGSTRGFGDHLKATNVARFTGGQEIDVPVTIAYGERERLLSKRARRDDELPPHARWIDLPGCGHVAMSDDPERVAAVILETTQAAVTSRG